MKWVGHVALMGKKRSVHRIFVVKSEGKTLLGRPRHKWEDIINVDHQEVGWGHGLDWSGSGEGQVADCCECGNELSGPIKCGKFLD